MFPKLDTECIQKVVEKVLHLLISVLSAQLQSLLGAVQRYPAFHLLRTGSHHNEASAS